MDYYGRVPIMENKSTCETNVEENDYELFEWALKMQMKLKRDLHIVVASSRTSAYRGNKLYKHLIIVVHLAYREYFSLAYYS